MQIIKSLLAGVLPLSLALGCGGWHPLEGTADDFGRLFLENVDTGNAAAAYLLTTPEFRRRQNFMEFSMALHQRYEHTGFVRERKGAQQFISGEQYAWLARTQVQASVTDFSETLMTSRRGVGAYRISQSIAAEEESSTLIKCVSASCEALNGRVQNVLAAANATGTWIGTLYLQSINKTAGGSTPLTREFVAALETGDHHSVRRLLAFEVPESFLNLELSNLTYFGYVTISDPQISRYFGTVYYYQGNLRAQGKDWPAVITLNSNEENMNRLSGVDVFTYTLNHGNSFFIMDRDVMEQRLRSMQAKPK